MNEIIKKQQELLKCIAKNHSSLDNPSARKMDNRLMVSYIKDHLFFFNEEITELLLAIGDDKRAILKPWSRQYYDIASREFTSTSKVRSEAIDALCFCLNICIAVGITPENIDEEYCAVWSKNMTRQKEGY